MKKTGAILRYLTALTLCLALALSGPLCLAAGEDQSMVGLVYNERNGLPTGEANDVLQTADGYIWVGSYGGLIRYDGSEFRNFSTEGLLPSSSVRMLFEDRAGRLWIGTNDAGVFVLENGQITRPQGQPGDSFLCVRGFAEDAQGTVYACSNSGVGQIRDGVMEVYTDPQVAGRTVYSLAVDRLGRVWGASDSFGGCVVLQQGAVVGTVSSADYFADGEGIYSITGDGEGAVWLGGSENHLVRLVPRGDGPAGDQQAAVGAHVALAAAQGHGVEVQLLQGLGLIGGEVALGELHHSLLGGGQPDVALVVDVGAVEVAGPLVLGELPEHPLPGVDQGVAVEAGDPHPPVGQSADAVDNGGLLQGVAGEVKVGVA